MMTESSWPETRYEIDLFGTRAHIVSHAYFERFPSNLKAHSLNSHRVKVCKITLIY